MLYPIIALTYVWTTLLSYTLLGEPSNVYKNVGIVDHRAGCRGDGPAGDANDAR